MSLHRKALSAQIQEGLTLPKLYPTVQECLDRGIPTSNILDSIRESGIDITPSKLDALIEHGKTHATQETVMSAKHKTAATTKAATPPPSTDQGVSSTLAAIRGEFKKAFPKAGRVALDEVRWIKKELERKGITASVDNVMFIRGKKSTRKAVSDRLNRLSGESDDSISLLKGMLYVLKGLPAGLKDLVGIVHGIREDLKENRVLLQKQLASLEKIEGYEKECLKIVSARSQGASPQPATTGYAQPTVGYRPSDTTGFHPNVKPRPSFQTSVPVNPTAWDSARFVKDDCASHLRHCTELALNALSDGARIEGLAMQSSPGNFQEIANLAFRCSPYSQNVLMMAATTIANKMRVVYSIPNAMVSGHRQNLCQEGHCYVVMVSMNKSLQARESTHFYLPNGEEAMDPHLIHTLTKVVSEPILAACAPK